MTTNTPHKARHQRKEKTEREFCPISDDEQRLRSFQEVLTNELDEILSSPPPELQEPYKIHAVRRQLKRLSKRLVFKGRKERDCIQEFLDVNSIVATDCQSLHPDIILYAREFVYRALAGFTHVWAPGADHQNVLDLPLLLRLWRCGPGSSVGHAVATDHFSKMVGRWTVTERALPLARLLVNIDPLLCSFHAKNKKGFEVVKGSSLGEVPKNEDVGRTVCTEPLWNMNLQLAAGMYLEGALRYIGIDLAKQESLNQDLALLGSLDGNLATLDLKSASDLISLALIQLLWPQSWYELFMAIRSPYTTVPSKGRVTVQLNMMSTMGNGFTFPMMTLTLSALVWANSMVNGHGDVPDFKISSEYGHAVYGDDIIVPVHEFTSLTKTLTSAGLIINTDKSYCEGYFRESCGGDYYEGYFITPFYVSSLRQDSEIYVAINKLLDWSGGFGVIPFRTLLLLLSFISGPRALLVPEWEADTAGIRTRDAPRRYYYLRPFRKRWVRSVKAEHIDLLMQTVLFGSAMPVEGEIDTFAISPRSPNGKPVKYECVKSDRPIPKAYLNGHCPLSRTSEASKRISWWIAIATISS